MAEVINRLRKDKLPPDEFKYVSDMPMYELFWEEKLRKAADKANRKVMKAEQEVMKAEQEVMKAGQEVMKEKEKNQKLIKLLLLQGGTIQTIADTLEMTFEETEELIKLIEKNKS
jgi:cbb3-type cytochrome oxidase cytochrome c subunit